MFSKRKFLIGISGTLFIVLIAGFLFVRHLITRSFPDYEATIYSEQLHDPVTVYRDEFGVPLIKAANEADAFFAAGFVHAQDRLWQMDISRRAGEGRLAEVLGADAVPIDLLFRTLDLRGIVSEIHNQLPDTYRSFLESYARGVNFYIQQSKGRYPIEFDILKYEPEPWHPTHSLLIGKLMAWDLTLAWWVDVALGQVVEEIEFDLALQAIPGYPRDAPVIAPQELRERRVAKTLRTLRSLDSQYRALAGIKGTQVGSNSWVVSGNHTASGKPMLANDPHLALSAPSRWYEMTIHAGNELNVSGMTLPGIPLIIIGRNRAIAWGLTNLMADDCDFYLEDIDTTTSTPRYRMDGLWHDLIVRKETIRIANGDEVTKTIYETHRGPLVQSILGQDIGTWENQAISMRWTGRAVSFELITFYLINKATNFDEFREALRHFEAPGQNFIYADTAGNIGYRAAARLPIRPRGNPMLPFPGWDSRYDWTGYVPFEELPEVYNPPSGIIATANNKVVDDTYPYYISSLWEHPSRIRRILQMIDDTDNFTVSDFKRMQNDFVSVHAQYVVPYILSAFEHSEVQNPEIDRVLSYFRNWDFYFGPEDVPAAIFNTFMVKLFENTFLPRMGNQLYREYVALINVPYRVMDELLQSPNSEWFDNPHTPARERRDDVIRKSLHEALEFLRHTISDDIRTWRWGTLHTITLEHIFGQQRPIHRLVNIGPFPFGGASTTVNKGQFSISQPFEMHVGASCRFIVDMAHPSAAYTIIPTGQSGHPLHRHYNDQVQLWIDGRYKITLMEPAKNKQYRIMQLLPR